MDEGPNRQRTIISFRSGRALQRTNGKGASVLLAEEQEGTKGGGGPPGGGQ